MQIRIKRIENGKLPTYETIGAAGADCYARINKKVIVKAKTVETIPLGFAVEIPEGYEMQIRGRSGNARKKWVQVFDSPGTIDSDYRGEVGAILYNASENDFEVNPGDRIAQAIIAPVIQTKWEEVTELSETKRGTGGFGSTGISGNKEIEVSYPHKVEKFYEPFKTVVETQKYLGKKCLIDNEIECKFTAVNYDENNHVVVVFTDNSGNLYSMYLSQAFQRITVDGHRFGKEMEYENN